MPGLWDACGPPVWARNIACEGLNRPRSLGIDLPTPDRGHDKSYPSENHHDPDDGGPDDGVVFPILPLD